MKIEEFRQNEAIIEAAAKLGLNVDELLEQIYRAKSEEYDKQDIRTFLDDKDMSYTEEEVDSIYEFYSEERDAERGTWDNISFACGLVGINVNTHGGSHECPYGGDVTDDCEGCDYSTEYHFKDGECVERKEEEF